MGPGPANADPRILAAQVSGARGAQRLQGPRGSGLGCGRGALYP